MKYFFKKKAILFAPVLLFFPAILCGQQVHYSPSPGYNAKATFFEIIGKHNGLRLIFTRSYGDYTITFFDKVMKPVDTVVLTSLPDEIKDIHFIDLRSGFIMLYQYMHRRDVLCKAALFDGQGKMRKPPVVIDKVTHPFRVLGDVTYSLVVSEDKNRILIFKIIRPQENELLKMSTFLLDSSLTLLQKGKFILPHKEGNAKPEQIKLSNEGGVYLAYGNKDFIYQPYFRNITLYYKSPITNRMITNSITFKKHFPAADVLLSINESTKTLWLNTFNYDTRQRHFIGLTTWQLDMDTLQVLQYSTREFSHETRKILADKRSRRKSAFDQFVPQKIIFSHSGTGLLIAEKQLMDADGQLHYGDVGFFNLDKKGILTKTQLIKKEPNPYGHSSMGSFLTLNRGSELHILLNMPHSVTRFLNGDIYLLRDYRYLSNKKLQPLPVMKNMDNGYHWLPQFGKQIGRDEAVIPCLDGGNLLFGSISY